MVAAIVASEPGLRKKERSKYRSDTTQVRGATIHSTIDQTSQMTDLPSVERFIDWTHEPSQGPL